MNVAKKIEVTNTIPNQEKVSLTLVPEMTAAEKGKPKIE